MEISNKKYQGFSSISKRIFEKNLLQFLCLYNNRSEFKEYGKILNILEEENIKNRIFITQKEKNDIINKIQDKIYYKLMNEMIYLYRGNLLIFLLSYIEHNRRFTTELINSINGSAPTLNKNNFTNIIINELNKSAKKNEIITGIVNEFLGMEKEYLENGIDLLIKENSFTISDVEITEKEYKDFLSYIYVIWYVRYIHISFTIGPDKNKELKFLDKDVNISKYNSLYRNDFITNQIENLVSYKDNFFQEDLEKINNLIEKYFNFNLADIDLLISKLKKDENDIFFEDKVIFKERIMKLAECDENRADSIIRYFKYVSQKRNYGSFQSRKNNKILKKPIIEIYEKYIVIKKLLIYTLELFLLNPKTIESSDNEFKKQLEYLSQRKNNQFEEEVFNEIKKYFSTSEIIVKKDIGEKDIKGVVPPGQIDILCLYRKNIIVIECKNLDLKTNHRETINQIKKIRGEFEKKLVEKVEYIKNNKSKVLNYLENREVENYSEYNVEGVIVFKNYTVELATEEKVKRPISRITWEKLCDWIKEKG